MGPAAAPGGDRLGEERRAFYVAASRPQRGLILLSTPGPDRPLAYLTSPSRFLAPILAGPPRAADEDLSEG
jgi:hypothetical protein